MFLAAITLINLVQYAIIALIILAVVYILLRLGKNILKWLIGVVINSVLGFIAIFLLDYIFGLGIPFNLAVIAVTALFGLPAVGTIVVLKLAGMLA